MSATDKRLCDTCMNDKCPYGGKGPVIDREPTEMCEHYESMSGSDKLRRLLDERGVKHEGGERSVRWRDRNGVIMHAFPLASGELGLEVWSCTPEQAIAATLGSEEAYTREDVEGAFVSGYSLGSLPVGSDPRWDENSQTVDEHMAELGWVRAAKLGDIDATAMRQDDADLAAENAKLRELVRDLYKRFHGVVLENWSYSTEDFDMLACRMRELGVDVL